KTSHKRIAAAGGVFSNIKMNMKLAAQREVENIYVFPHMGDGGLAIGAAMIMNHDRFGISGYSLPSLALGPSFTVEEVWAALQNNPGTDTHAQRKEQRSMKIPPYPPLEKGGYLPLLPLAKGEDSLLPPLVKGVDLLLPPLVKGGYLPPLPLAKGEDSLLPPLVKGGYLPLLPLAKGEDLLLPPLVKGGGGDFHLNTAVGEDSATEKSAAAEAGQETHRHGDLLFLRIDSAPETAARLILTGEIILWFQGRMEIGPRSLGNRSILARPDDSTIKDRLNLLLKKRVWYQPFCPSILVEDAPALLHTDGQNLRDNPFMTMAFRVRDEKMKMMAGVINIDGTCRPQLVGDEHPLYRDLLEQIKKILGYGVLLNTSFNIHGEPVVCTPQEAIDMLQRTGIRYLVIEDILVENMAAYSMPLT
ncbi:MAG: carbamoyltransferase C-terminal domain-containing protein, partial [Syntrophales bacterium]